MVTMKSTLLLSVCILYSSIFSCALAQAEENNEARGVFVHNESKSKALEVVLQINDEKPVNATIKPLTTLLIYEKKATAGIRYQLPLNGILLKPDGIEFAKAGPTGAHFTFNEQLKLNTSGGGVFKLTKDYFEKNATEGKEFDHLKRVEITIANLPKPE